MLLHSSLSYDLDKQLEYGRMDITDLKAQQNRGLLIRVLDQGLKFWYCDNAYSILYVDSHSGHGGQVKTTALVLC